MDPNGETTGKPGLSAGFIGIIVFKCLKGAAFILMGLAVLHIARLARHSEPMQIARLLGVDQSKLVVQHLSVFLEAFTAGQVEAIGAAAFVIGLIFATEGTLLAMRIWWAPYFTIVLTALGIPPELIEIFRRPASGRRYLLLAINVAILIYLWKRRNEFKSSPSG